MKFPHISIKSTNYVVTPQIESLLDQKFEMLGKFLDGVHDVRCEVTFEKIGGHHSGKIFTADMNLFIEGNTYHATATEEQMEQSIDSIREEIKRVLVDAHGKRQSLMKRGGLALKNMLRFGK
jgi:ribosomal subunit interface protein